MHLAVGYSVIALTQTVEGVLDPKVNPNQIDVLLKLLKPRPGVVLLKRLTIILDASCDKGFGLVSLFFFFYMFPNQHVM